MNFDTILSINTCEFASSSLLKQQPMFYLRGTKKININFCFSFVRFSMAFYHHHVIQLFKHQQQSRSFYLSTRVEGHTVQGVCRGRGGGVILSLWLYVAGVYETAVSFWYQIQIKMATRLLKSVQIFKYKIFSRLYSNENIIKTILCSKLESLPKLCTAKV